MKQPLLSLVASVVDERPTLEQVDAMLVELGKMHRVETVRQLIDDLLDYRGAVMCATLEAVA